MAASLSIRLVAETEAGAVYAWAEAAEPAEQAGGHSGHLLFSPPGAVFHECDPTGVVDPAGMRLDLTTQDLSNRHPARWRPFVQSAHGVWTRYAASARTGFPPRADRVFH